MSMLFFFVKKSGMDSINTKKLILASQSPRRKELLKQIGMDIEICPSKIDERGILIKDPVEHVKGLARMKAEDTASSYPDTWVIGADTIVVIQDQILGKPSSKSDAISMLNKLNDCEHFVYTAFCLCNQESDSYRNQSIIKSVKTKVYFKNLTDKQIKWYVHTQEPFDKAGGYGIQGVGSFMVKKISGSYTNVVGLPLCEVVEEMIKLNLIEFKEQ